MRNATIGIILLAVGVTGIAALTFFSAGTLDMDRVESIAERYLDSLNDQDLGIDEIMEFEYNFYAIYYEKSTGIGAFEMLIDKGTGSIFPEYGPNMMWNTKYGHGGMMGGGMMGTPSQSASMPVGEEEALNFAQEFLDRVYPGAEAEDPHRFYGYYTIHTSRDGEILGMLSVNGYDGRVWYHNWHGAFIQSREMH